MKKLIVFLCLFVSSFLYGQDKDPFQYIIWVGEKQYNYLITKYEEGEVNLSNGKFIYGLINRDLTEPKITVIDIDTTVYKSDEIVDFKLKTASKIISTKVDGKYVFLQHLPIQEGLIKMYTYDQILKQEKKTSGGNFVSNPIEYNRIVEIVFEKNGYYTKLYTTDDVYSLVEDNKIVMDYSKKIGELKLSNLDQIVQLIEFYNIATN